MKTLFKTLGVLVLFFFLVNVGLGQTTYTWNTTNGDWQTSTNWTPERTSPATDDKLVFNSGATFTVSNIPEEEIGSISISGYTIVTFNALDAGTTLTLNNASGYALTIENGSSLSLIAVEDEAGTTLAGAFLINVTTAEIFGAINCYAIAPEGYDPQSSYNHKIVTSSLITFGSSSSFTYGPYTTLIPLDGPAVNTIQFESGSTFINITGTNPSTDVQFKSGSLYRHSNLSTPTLMGRTYGNFEYSSGAIKTLTGSSAFTVENLTISSGTLEFKVSGTHSIKGNIFVDVGATLIFNTATNAGSTFNLNGTSLQTITNNGTFYCKSQNTTYTSTINVVSGSIVDLGGSVIRTDANKGAFVVATGATIKIGSPDGIVSTGDFGNIQTYTRTFNTGANYEYNGTTAQVSGNALPSTVNNLTFNNSGIVSNGIGVSLTNNVAVTGTANVQSGLLIFNGKNITGTTFTLTDGAKIKIDSPDGISSSGATGHVQTTTRTFGTGADYEYAGSSTQYTGSGLPTTIRNLTISNTAGTYLSNNYTVTGTADVKSGAILVCNTKYLDGVTGSFDLNSGGSIKICSSNGITASSSAGNVRTAIRTYSTGGKYEYVGSSAQITGDGLPSSVHTLTINNSNGVTLTNHVSVSNTCALTSGNIKLGDKNLKILSGGSLSGSFDGSHMIVTNGTGELQKEITANGTLTFPIGDLLGNYTNASLNFTSGTYGTGAYAGMKVTNSKLPENTSTSVYLNRYWDVNQSNISNFNCNVMFQYLVSDIAGSEPNENDLWGGRYSSSAWYILLKVNTTDHQIVGSTTGFSKFTGGQEGAMPVSLQSFTSNVSGRNVGLKWVTSSETNNAGFNIERKCVDGDWTNAGYVSGSGTKNTPTTYNFNDMRLNSGKYNYRLKQIDNNGNFEYHNLDGVVEVGVPKSYELSQNYPNPFNPTTKIDFALPFNSKVNIVIYDMTGREVKTLVNEARTAGYYTVELNASSLSSGTYFYRIIANNGTKDYINTKKMVLVK